MNGLVILVNVAAYLLDVANDRSFMQRYMLEADDPRVLHFLTYAFLHINLLHLGVNMLLLLIFGPNVEDLLGHAGYGAFYLGGAVFSGVGFLVAGGDLVIGASGAVGAVMAAYLVFFPRSLITVSVRVRAVDIRSTWVVVGFFLYTLAMSLIVRFTSRGTAFEANDAHLAGLLFGFAVAVALLLLGLLQRHPFDLLGLVDRWNRRRQYRSLVREGYDPFLQRRGAAATTAGAPGPLPLEEGKALEPREQPADASAVRIATLRTSVADAIAQRNLPLAADLFRQLKELDPKQFLPRQAQLDVANQLASQQLYADAADAYEQFLHYYPQFEQIEEVHLMLGLVYARYLNRYARAKECLMMALLRLHGESQTQLAKAELARIEPLLPPPRQAR
jgi:membrane associated rhomboid family serine protease